MKTPLELQLARHHSSSHVDSVGGYTSHDIAQSCVEYVEMGHFKKVCCSKRNRAINEMEQEMSQEYSKGETETVSIDSVHMNRKWSMLTAKVEVCTGITN